MSLPDFFGLDIGNHTIKIAQISWQGKTPVLSALNTQSTPFGVIGSENEEHQKQLSEAIKACVNNARGLKSTNVVVAVPEASIFTQLITVPKVEEAKLEETVRWEAKKYIHIPIDEVRLDWIFLGERSVDNRAYLDLFIIAAPNVLVDRFISVLSSSGLEAIAIETESVATTRAIWNGLEGKDTTPTMILDFGAESTDMSVIQGGSLLFSQSMATGSDALTKAIASTFNLEMQQAEQYKINYGLDDSQVEGKIANAIKPIVQVIVSEVSKTLDFFRSRFPNSTPRKLLIVGDGAQLPGLMQYLTEGLGLETGIADPFANLTISKKIEKDVSQVSSVGYSVSIGLALKKE